MCVRHAENPRDQGTEELGWLTSGAWMIFFRFLLSSHTSSSCFTPAHHHTKAQQGLVTPWTTRCDSKDLESV